MNDLKTIVIISILLTSCGGGTPEPTNNNIDYVNPFEVIDTHEQLSEAVRPEITVHEEEEEMEEEEVIDLTNNSTVTPPTPLDATPVVLPSVVVVDVVDDLSFSESVLDSEFPESSPENENNFVEDDISVETVEESDTYVPEIVSPVEPVQAVEPEVVPEVVPVPVGRPEPLQGLERDPWREPPVALSEPVTGFPNTPIGRMQGMAELLTINEGEMWDCYGRLLFFNEEGSGEGVADDNGYVSFNFSWELIPNEEMLDLYVDGNSQSFYLYNLVMQPDGLAFTASTPYEGAFTCLIN